MLLTIEASKKQLCHKNTTAASADIGPTTEGCTNRKATWRELKRNHIGVLRRLRIQLFINLAEDDKIGEQDRDTRKPCTV